METQTEKGLDCSEPILAKILIASWNIGILLWLVFDFGHGNICLMMFASFLGLGALLQSPDMTLYADGIELSYFGFRHFVEWKDITHLHRGGGYYKISYRKKPWLVSLLTLGNPLPMRKWRNNYQDAIAIIEDNVLG